MYIEKEIVLSIKFLLEFKWWNNKHNVGTYTNTTDPQIAHFLSFICELILKHNMLLFIVIL